MSLTIKQIDALQPTDKPKRYADGFGLYLEISPKGSKLWRLKYRLAGKERRLSIGAYPAVSLKEARDAAQAAKLLIKEGVDPSIAKRAPTNTGAHPGATSFQHVADLWFQKNKGLWTEAHASKIKSRLDHKIYPSFGSTQITDVTPPIILDFFDTIESTYLVHALLSLVGRIFRFAVAKGYITSDPCRDLRGAFAPHKEKKMPAITNPIDVGIMAAKIDRYDGMVTTRGAMQLMLLCMCRTQEVRWMRWGDIDFDERMWRIPSDIMKRRREHLVPLSRQALILLEQLRPITGECDLVFPSYCLTRKKNTPIGKNTINCALRSMGYVNGEVVGHGFRSAASTLLNELGWNPDAVEMQLAHAPADKVRSAYNRAAYLHERRRMLQAWADHLDALKAKAGRT